MPKFTHPDQLNNDNASSGSETALGGGDDAQKVQQAQGIELNFEESQDDDDICIKEKNNVLPPHLPGDSRSQEAAKMFSILDGNNNASSAADDDGIDDDVQVVAMTASTQKSAKRKMHPHTSRLMTMCSEAALTLLKAADDVGCSTCATASDKADAKGNKWAKSHDVCHGGGTFGGGCMAKHGWDGPTKVSNFKKKTQDCWKHGKDDKEKVSPVACECCVRQSEEFEEACTKEKENSKSQRAIADKMQADVVACQTKKNARPDGAGRLKELPPGHRGQSGMGRGQHSANLVQGQPATFACADLVSNQDVSPVSSATGAGNNGTTSDNCNNSASAPKAPGRHSPTRGTATIHNAVLESVSSTQSNLNALTGLVSRGGVGGSASASGGIAGGIAGDGKSKRDRRIERLEKKSKKLETEMEMFKSLGEEDDHKKALAEFKSASEMLSAHCDESSEEENQASRQ